MSSRWRNLLPSVHSVGSQLSTYRSPSQSCCVTMHERYIGARTMAEAAACLEGTLSDFRVYHLMKDASLPVCLPLVVAYVTSFGAVHHYAIRSYVATSPNCSSPSYRRYHVELGVERSPPCFDSVDALLRFYSGYAHVMPDHKSIELFPWWQMDAEDLANK